MVWVGCYGHDCCECIDCVVCDVGFMVVMMLVVVVAMIVRNVVLCGVDRHCCDDC